MIGSTIFRNFKLRTSNTSLPEWLAESDDKSIIDRWKDFYKEKKATGHESKLALYLTRGLLAFQAPTQLYIFLYYFIPYFFQDYDDWTKYYAKVFVFFCCLEGLANYFCCIFYDTSYHPTKDRPNIRGLNQRWNTPPEQFTPFLSSSNGHVVNGLDAEEENQALEWKYCDVCDIRIPPRASHCKTCKKCILKRDHHCYLVGTCIGFRNQRYFVVLVFYAFLVGSIGAFCTFYYLKDVYYPDSYSWADFFLPVTLFRVILGSIPLHIGIMIFHFYTEVLFGFIGFVYCNAQFMIISSGKTLYELSKEIPVKSTASINSQFVSVFGHFWILNFLFPMQLVFRQIGDGTVWKDLKIDRSASKAY